MPSMEIVAAVPASHQVPCAVDFTLTAGCRDRHRDVPLLTPPRSNRVRLETCEWLEHPNRGWMPRLVVPISIPEPPISKDALISSIPPSAAGGSSHDLDAELRPLYLRS